MDRLAGLSTSIASGDHQDANPMQTLVACGARFLVSHDLLESQTVAPILKRRHQTSWSLVSTPGIKERAPVGVPSST